MNVSKLTVAFAAVFAVTANAANEVKIHTGGDQGAYFKDYGTKLVQFLDKSLISASKEKSDGTVDNMEKVSSDPMAMGLGQMDVYAQQVGKNQAYANNLKILRSDVGFECLYAVTNDELYTKRGISSWNKLVDVAGRIRLATGSAKSGNAATLEILKGADAKLADLDETLYTEADQGGVSGAIEMVANGKAHVAFFVQTPDPSNSIFVSIKQKGLKFIPVATPAIASIKVENKAVYELREINVGADKPINSVCTSVVYFANKNQASGKDDKETKKLRGIQADIEKSMKGAAYTELLPDGDRFAKMSTNAKKLEKKAAEGFWKAMGYGADVFNSLVDKLN